MKWGFKEELNRKIVHLMTIFFLIGYVLFGVIFNIKIALLLLIFVLILFITLDYIRIELKKKIPLINGLWRKEEESRVGGQVFFLISAIICLAVFDFKIAAVAILMTTFGDFTAAIIGKRFGKTIIYKKKALEGVIAQLIVDIIIAYLILNNWYVILVMVITATIVETVTSKLDDNLLIPLFSGFSGQIISMMLKLI